MRVLTAFIGVLAIGSLPPRRGMMVVCPSCSVIKLEVLKSVILEDIVGDGVVVVDTVDEFLQTGLVPVLLLQIEDYGATDQRSQDC